MHTLIALLCFVVVIHWLIFPYPSGLLHWHCGNLTIAPVPAKQPWWIWINTSCEFIMNDWITTTKQSTTKPCAYFLGYTAQSMLLIVTSWYGDNFSVVTQDKAGREKARHGIALRQPEKTIWAFLIIRIIEWSVYRISYKMTRPGLIFLTASVRSDHPFQSKVVITPTGIET